MLVVGAIVYPYAENADCGHAAKIRYTITTITSNGRRYSYRCLSCIGVELNADVYGEIVENNRRHEYYCREFAEICIGLSADLIGDGSVNRCRRQILEFAKRKL